MLGRQTVPYSTTCEYPVTETISLFNRAEEAYGLADQSNLLLSVACIVAAVSTLLIIPYLDYFFFNKSCYQSDDFKSNVVNISTALLVFATSLSIISYLGYRVLAE